MNSLLAMCKLPFAWLAKWLKNGAGYRIRTRGPLITKPVALLETNGFPVNRASGSPHEPANSPTSVNQGETPGLHNATHISDILDRLPAYFEKLRALREADEDAYAIFSKIGGTIASRHSRFAASVEPDMIANPPTIRCLFQLADTNTEKDTVAPLIYMMRLAGGQVCVSRDGCTAYLPQGICYRVVIAYVLDEKPYGGSFFVHIEQDGAVRLLSERRPTVQRLGNDRFMRLTTGQPRWLKTIAAEKGQTPDQFVAGIVAIAMSCKRPKEAILVRASQGNMTAAWTIDRNDAKRFFAKRETGLATDGRRKRVLHYVGDFERVVDGSIQNVRQHYRGERSFDWNGYAIEISGLGFHHADYFDADIPGYEDETRTNQKMIGMDRISAMLRRHYSRPVFLTKRRQSPPHPRARTGER